MSKYKFSISIASPTEKEAQEKAQALAVLAAHLDAKTLKALAHLVQTDPAKVELAKGFLGVG